MVFLVVKGSEDQQFLLDVPVGTPTSEAIATAVGIWNLRLIVLRLRASATQLLSAYSKPESTSAASDENLQQDDLISSLERLELSGLSAKQADTLRRSADDAAAYIHKDQVTRKVCLTAVLLQEHVARLQGQVKEALLSARLTDSLISQLLEQSQAQDLDPGDTEMWFVGKPLPRTGKLSDRLGPNNKTKVVVRLQQIGLGAPAREPRLAADDLDYNSPWADPRSLKHSFSGLGAVRLK